VARAKPTRSDPLLAAALERLEAGEHEPALASLLEAWRATGDPGIANLVDRLSAIVVEGEPPIAAVGGVSAKAAWYAAAKARRPAALPRLLEAVPDGLDRVKRLEALLEWPADPRVGTMAREWLERPPVQGKNRAGFFNALWKLIEYSRDARLSKLVASISTDRAGSVNRYGLKSWTALTELGERFERLPAPATLAPDPTELVERIGAMLDKPVKKTTGTSANEAELFERIYADPSDDEPRAVLADLLQQRGDPRGEFIALQLARHGTDQKPTTAEKKLLQQWGRTWLGQLDEVLLKDGIEFERGFLTRARYMGARPSLSPHGAPEWQTVTHLDVSRASKFVDGSGAILVTPALRNLRHVTGLAPSDWSRLAAAASLPWETVGWRVWHWGDGSGALAEPAGQLFAAARTLVIEQSESRELRMKIESVVELLERWPNVETFETSDNVDLARPILARPCGKRLKRLVINGAPLRIEVEGGSLVIDVHWAVEDTVTAIVALMKALQPKNVAITAGSTGRLEGDKLAIRHAGVSIKRIVDLARILRVPLSVQGTKFGG
jgi:uncharacterized protein (TIGR02996 family)